MNILKKIILIVIMILIPLTFLGSFFVKNISIEIYFILAMAFVIEIIILFYKQKYVNNMQTKIVFTNYDKQEFENIIKKNNVPFQNKKVFIYFSKQYGLHRVPAVIWKQDNKAIILVISKDEQKKIEIPISKKLLLVYKEKICKDEDYHPYNGYLSEEFKRVNEVIPITKKKYTVYSLNDIEFTRKSARVIIDTFNIGCCSKETEQFENPTIEYEFSNFFALKNDQVIYEHEYENIKERLLKKVQQKYPVQKIKEKKLNDYLEYGWISKEDMQKYL